MDYCVWWNLWWEIGKRLWTVQQLEQFFWDPEEHITNLKFFNLSGISSLFLRILLKVDIQCELFPTESTCTELRTTTKTGTTISAHMTKARILEIIVCVQSIHLLHPTCKQHDSLLPYHAVITHALTSEVLRVTLVIWKPIGAIVDVTKIPTRWQKCLVPYLCNLSQFFLLIFLLPNMDNSVGSNLCTDTEWKGKLDGQFSYFSVSSSSFIILPCYSCPQRTSMSWGTICKCSGSNPPKS